MVTKPKINARKKRQAERIVETPEGMTRRGVMRLAGFGALGVVAAGGLGMAGVGMYQTYMREHDLNQIGKGKPAVVQVHDPQCPTCTALQRETRKAMKQFGECDVIYLVADITQPEGQIFARRHGVQHVTLVLMDGKGQVTQVLAGMRQRSELRPVLKAHFEAHGAKV